MKNSQKRFRLILLASGIILTVWGLLLSVRTASPIKADTASIKQLNEVNSFSQEPVKIDKNLLNLSGEKNKAVKQLPVRIIIPNLGINIPVKEARVVKGYWEVFPDTAGYGQGSASLDEIGNTVIFAHARQGLFLPLKQAKTGQEIFVLSRDNWYTYEIADIKEVMPTQTESIEPTKESVLTLYTCSGFTDSKRLIVQAKKK